MESHRRGEDKRRMGGRIRRGKTGVRGREGMVRKEDRKIEEREREMGNLPPRSFLKVGAYEDNLRFLLTEVFIIVIVN